VWFQRRCNEKVDGSSPLPTDGGAIAPPPRRLSPVGLMI
jgi:hypothetical protein